MAQGLRVLAAGTKDQCLFPSTHVGRLTTACYSSSWGLTTLFWLPWALAHITLTHRDAHGCVVGLGEMKMFQRYT